MIPVLLLLLFTSCFTPCFFLLHSVSSSSIFFFFVRFLLNSGFGFFLACLIFAVGCAVLLSSCLPFFLSFFLLIGEYEYPESPCWAFQFHFFPIFFKYSYKMTSVLNSKLNFLIVVNEICHFAVSWGLKIKYLNCGIVALFHLHIFLYPFCV